MADPHWYRNTTWTPEIAARFEQKLHRARDKADYLRIQAIYLTRAYPKVALELVDRYLAIPNQRQQALGHCTRAEALETLGRLDDAVTAYEAALARESECPNWQTNAYLELPTLIVQHEMVRHYGRAAEVLTANFDKLAFPVSLFQWHAAYSLVLEFKGDISAARAHARAALDAAAADHAGIERHPRLGLVGKRQTGLLSRIKHIAASAQAQSRWKEIILRRMGVSEGGTGIERLKSLFRERSALTSSDFREQRPLLQELAAAGLRVPSIDHLRSKESNLRPVLPILLRHLQRDYSRDIRNHIGTAIGMSRDLKGVGGQGLIACLRDEKENQIQGHLGHALAVAAVAADLQAITELLLKNRFSHWGRSDLPLAVGRLGGKQAIPFLIELLNDHPAVSHSAAKALIKLKAEEARPKIEAWAASCGPDWRQEAGKVLKKLRTSKWD